MACNDCKKEYEIYGSPSCYNCLKKEVNKEVDFQLFRDENLINILQELGYTWDYESYEPMEYSKSDFWIIYYKGKLVEDLTPKMLIELYNKIKDIENG